MSLFRTVQSLFEDKAFVPYVHTYALLKAMHAKRLQAHYLYSYGVKPLEALMPEYFKTSDTLFIMGSGASVNEYGDREWATIREADSLGFNFWLVHDFVPDVYVVEPPRAPRDVYMYELLTQRAEVYKDVPFVLKASDSAQLDLGRIPHRLRDQFYVGRSMPLPGRTPERIEQAYSTYARYGLFRPGRTLDTIVQQRASLAGLMHLALVWGYKNIILCGVDLNNTAYFYDEKRSYFSEKSRSVPSTGQSGAVHKTMDVTVGGVTVDQVVYAMNKVILKPRGVNLSVALSSSALHPELPAYFQ